MTAPLLKVRRRLLVTTGQVHLRAHLSTAEIISVSVVASNPLKSTQIHSNPLKDSCQSNELAGSVSSELWPSGVLAWDWQDISKYSDCACSLQTFIPTFCKSLDFFATGFCTKMIHHRGIVLCVHRRQQRGD